MPWLRSGSAADRVIPGVVQCPSELGLRHFPVPWVEGIVVGLRCLHGGGGDLRNPRVDQRVETVGAQRPFVEPLNGGEIVSSIDAQAANSGSHDADRWVSPNPP